VIDGALECGLALRAVEPMGWNGSAPLPDKRASYAAAWSEQGLYVYVEVRGLPLQPHPPGEPLFCGDAVELYVDSDAVAPDDAGTYDPAGTMQFVIAAPSGDGIEAARFVQGMPAGPWVSPNLRTERLPDGYAVEALIGAADIALWSWSIQSQLGFSLAIDVSGPDSAQPRRCGNQLGQFFLRTQPPSRVCPGEPWCDARAFCAPLLAR